MSRDLVASLVEARPRQDYEKLLLVRFTLLRETLLKNAETGTLAADYLQENLAPVRNLKAQVVLKKATPFFWMNLQRCYSASWNDPGSLLDQSRNLLMMAFDSFFEELPQDHSFVLQSEKEFSVVLPRLGIAVSVPEGRAILRRADDTTLEINSPDQQFSIDVTNVPANYRLPSLRVPDSPATLLLSCDPALLEDDYIFSIELDTEHASSLMEQINKALKLTRLVDEKLGALIDRYISWYIPLVNPNPESTHYSFTSKNLPGVMFLSGSYKFLPLCEAIIHEYHHHELYVLMGTQDVLGDETGKLFYSPWRTDARPLTGLFHALHVFTGVADFYSRAASMNLPELEPYEESIRYRRVLLYHQLKIGLAQVPLLQLPPLGRKIYEYMEQELKRQEKELGDKVRAMPKELLRHFDDWSTLYSELVPEVKLSPEFLSQLEAEHAGQSPQQMLRA
jgi:HEXXH motif-containing protein